MKPSRNAMKPVIGGSAPKWAPATPIATSKTAKIALSMESQAVIIRMRRADRKSTMAAVCPLASRVTEFVEHFRPASLYERAPIVG